MMHDACMQTCASVGMRWHGCGMQLLPSMFGDGVDAAGFAIEEAGRAERRGRGLDQVHTGGQQKKVHATPEGDEEQKAQ